MVNPYASFVAVAVAAVGLPVTAFDGGSGERAAPSNGVVDACVSGEQHPLDSAI